MRIRFTTCFLVRLAVIVVCMGADYRTAWADPPINAGDALGDPLPRGARVRLGTTRFRLRHSCLTVALSPDGKWLACDAAYTSRIRLFEAATGRRVPTPL